MGGMVVVTVCGTGVSPQSFQEAFTSMVPAKVWGITRYGTASLKSFAAKVVEEKSVLSPLGDHVEIHFEFVPS